MILTVVTVFLTLAVTFGAPFVAKPLAGVLKLARQTIDDKLKWDGPDSEKKEEIEDKITNLSVVLASVAVFAGVGAVYVWYVQTYTFAVNPWMYRLVHFLPVVGNAQVGYYDTFSAIYWTAIYWFAYVWGRKTSVRKR